MARVYCLDCDGRINFGSEAGLGVRLVCPLCGAELEVISLDPPEVDWAYDWDWEEEEEKVIW